MNRTLVKQNLIFAPYFIFLRCNGSLADSDILQRFGLAKYSRGRFAPQTGLYSVIADDGKWTMLADNWQYQLWFNPATRIEIAHLAKEFDVFTCSAGDSDDSFDFIYYRDGKLARKYVVSDPNYSGGSVTEDFGKSLEMESDILEKHGDQLEIVLALAQSIGIKTDYAEDELRIYVSPEVVQCSPQIVA